MSTINYSENNISNIVVNYMYQCPKCKTYKNYANLSKYYVCSKCNVNFKRCILGNGSFGTVYLNCEFINNNPKYFCTKLVEIPDSKYDYARILNEIKILKYTTDSKDFNYNLNYYSAIINKSSKKITMHLEFYNYKDLSSFFDKFPNGLPERIINIMFYQISLSLVELHKHNIIHRDIKPSNIFVKKDSYNNYKFVIGDYGDADFVNPQERLTTSNPTLHYTPYYRPPELLDFELVPDKPVEIFYGLESDMWSLGCVFWEILTRSQEIKKIVDSSKNQKYINIIQNPLLYVMKTKKDENLLDKILINLYYIFDKNYTVKENLLNHFPLINQISDNKLDLLLKLLQINPSNRLNFKNILNHDYFIELKKNYEKDYLTFLNNLNCQYNNITGKKRKFIDLTN